MPISRMAAAVEYDGSEFFGWQRQRQSPTVQEVLELALSRVADDEIVVECAGRTDTGVHAAGQVVHWDTSADRSVRSWLLGANTHLPASVSLRWCGRPAAGFHARYTATSRTYRYRIFNGWLRPAIERHHMTWYRHPLSAEAMDLAAQALIGEHDFSAFRAAGCQAKHARRNLTSISVKRRREQIDVRVSANAFLYHMVRNIVGSLIKVGRGDVDPNWIAEVLESRDRTTAGATAAAGGLCLMSVEYPASFGVPSPPWPTFAHEMSE